MMKLMKYDWKRNATAILATLVVLLLAQTVLTVAGWWKGWNEIGIYIGSIMMYGLVGFLAFLMACYTFNANIKAYSRRLLPIPYVYTIMSPIVLLIAAQLLLVLIYTAHDFLFAALYKNGQEPPLMLLAQYLNGIEIASVLMSSIWGMLFATVIIFFGIAFSKSIDGKAGVFSGILVCLALCVLVSWVEWLIFPGDNDSSHRKFRLNSRFDVEYASCMLRDQKWAF